MPLAQSVEQLGFMLLRRRCIPEILDLTRVGGQVKLLTKTFIEEMYQFPIAGADHIHKFSRLQNYITPVRGEDLVPPTPFIS